VADNVTLDPGAGGAVIAADDVTSVFYQKVKLDGGGDGATTPIVAGGGVEASALRVTVASDSTGVLSVDDNGGSLTVDGTVTANLAAGTNNIGDVDVLSIAAGDNNIGNVDIVSLPALPAGTNNIGDVDVLTLPALPAGTNNIGDVDVLTIAAGSNAIGNIGVIPRTTGGLSIFRTLDADETEEEIKATAGQVFGWYIYNDGATEVYVKFYNATAATVVVGTTTPVLTLPVPAGSAANVFSEIGIAFGTAICIAATTGVADADTAAPAANQVIANVFYS
jgi:hypothetical protein